MQQNPLSDDDLRRAFDAADRMAQQGDRQATEDARAFAQELQRRGLLGQQPAQPSAFGGVGMAARSAARREARGGQNPEIDRTTAAGLGATDTFFAGFADEITGRVMQGAEAIANIPRALRGDETADLDQTYNYYRGVTQDAQNRGREAHPVSTMAGNVGGGVALALTGGGAVGAASPSAGTAISTAARTAPIRLGIATGGVEGGAYGIGSGEGNLGERVRGAGDEALIGAGIGGLIPGGAAVGRNVMRGGRQIAEEVGSAVRNVREALPALEELRNATRAAYQAVDDAGARYSPRSMERLASDIQTEAAGMSFNPRRHPRTASMLAELDDMATRPHSLMELEQLRQIIRRDVVNPNQGEERAFGVMMIEQIDNMIDNAVPQGAGENAGQLVRTARQASRTQRAAEELESAVEAALDRASSGGTGGNTQNAIRQNLRRLITNPRTARLFTDEQKDVIRQAIRGDSIQNTLRILSGLSPDRGFLQMVAGGGSLLAAGPVGAVVPAVGYAARQLAEGRAGNQLNNIRRMVRTGSSGN